MFVMAPPPFLPLSMRLLAKSLPNANHGIVIGLNNIGLCRLNQSAAAISKAKTKGLRSFFNSLCCSGVSPRL
jgi:hypothetical protein